MRKTRDIHIVARHIQALGEMLVLSGRIGEAVKEDDGASGPPAMRQENGATSRSDHAIIEFLLLHNAADGVGVVSRGRGVRYEIAGLGRNDGGERNHENHPGNDASEPFHFETYSRSGPARRSHGVQHGSGEPVGHLGNEATRLEGRLVDMERSPTDVVSPVQW